MARSSRDEWAKRVAQWIESGLGGAEFSARLGVKESTLRHWKWQLSREGRAQRSKAPDGARPAFVEIAAVSNGGFESARQFELVLRDGLHLRIPPSFDEAVLRRLLAVLEGPPAAFGTGR